MTATVSFSAVPGDLVDPPALAAREIHLWSARLDLSPERVKALAAVLSEEERRRAHRFRFPRHRRRFEAGWGITRALLGAYVQTPPDRIELRYGSQGKPALERPDSAIEFNLSHTGEHLLIALRRDLRLGVDVEQLRPVHQARSIARRFFSADELQRLDSLPTVDYMRGFFNCWTRKEALVKAVGEGVFMALDRFDVSLEPDQPARLLSIDGGAADAVGWSLFHLAPASGLIGALATDDPSAPLPRGGWAIDAERQSLPGVD